jgi:uncharacterized protein with NAD-binding domain and iron-sulfur cluster
MSARSDKPRVAIVGGGCAAMTTAYELTHGENAGRFDVTVYQMGWRLGGKGASGRGRGGRIEEHGLHLWMGHYDNAFGLIRRCYADLGLDWRDAFTPAPDVGLMHPRSDGRWETLLACFPPMPGTPGDPRELSVSDLPIRAVKLLLALLRAAEQVGRETQPPGPQRDESVPDGGNASGLRRWLGYGELGVLTAAQHGLSLLQMGLGTPSKSPGPALVLSKTLDEIGVSLQNLLRGVLARDTASRYLWEIIDVVLAQVRGALRMLRDSLTLEDINRYDIRDWLRQNGACEQSLESSFVRGLYDLAFAYADGDPGRAGIAAGEGLLGSVRMFMTYRESLFWKMQGGMGDVVFAPLYRELKRRGVRFEFFHRLENVGLARHESPSIGDTPHVSSLTFTVQARSAEGAEYEPLIDYAGVPCWPAEPRWDRLEHGDALRAAGIDFEAPGSPGVRNRVLHVREDFDLVVLGISIASVPATCRELLGANERWERMAKHVATVPTQALQLWLKEDLAGLGWCGASPSVSAFVTPFDTWADMTHLAAIEDWPDRARCIAYFCSVLATDGTDPRAAAAQVRRNAVHFLDNDVHHLWPNAVTPSGFRWQLLAAPDEQTPGDGADAMETQFWRANVHPSDRYVLSLPGTIEHRISPLDRTWDNLTICGDWTDCGFNLGCVEAAVMSGRLAAHALSLHPRLEEIAAYDLV